MDAKSVAYLSWSNDRAEVAGRQLFETLRKIHLTNKRGNWFEEFWTALILHNIRSLYHVLLQSSSRKHRSFFEFCP